MKKMMVASLLASLPLVLGAPILHAQSYGPGAAMDASRMQESGPAVSGGNGMTVGPNSKNQAVMPMPGLRQDEELAERPFADTLPPRDVRPVTTPAAGPVNRR